jgi:hypothetical protein
MKKILGIAAGVIIFSAFINADNPLKNTKWTGEGGFVIFFTASDSVKLLADDQLITTAQYKVKDSLLIWRDITVSDATCDTSIRGTYIYRIKEDVLTFRIVSDRCEDRANVLQTLVLLKK